MQKKGTRTLLFVLMIAVGVGVGLAYGWLFRPASMPQEAELPRLRSDFKTDLVLMAAEEFAVRHDPLHALDELARIQPKDTYSLLVNTLNYAQGVGYSAEDIAKMQDLIKAIDPATYREWQTEADHGK